MAEGELDLTEYLVVLAALVATSSVGLYFGRSGKGSLENYMFGGETMAMLPIILSVVATFFTGLNQTALAQESYLYGSQPSLVAACFLVAAFVSTTFYLPVLHQFKNVSSFQYFEKRFNKLVRNFVSVIFMFDAVQRAAISIYVPSAAFSEASGLPMLLIAAALSIVCLICSATGGLKSVAWSDSLQAAILIVCTVCFLFLGISKAGGAAEFIRKAEEGGRLEFFNFDPSPYTRYTFWGALIGYSLFSMIFSLSPSFHQRYISVGSYEQSKRVIWFASIATALISFVSWMSGTIVYAFFAGCDPVLAKQGIQSHKMIYPYFVSKVTKGLPGLTGFFHASLMASGMSSATSFWNTVSCTMYEDFIRPKYQFSEKTAYRILILLTLVFAVLSAGGVVLASTFTSLFEASTAFHGFSHTALFVLYNAALFLPWVNAPGVVSGAVAGAIVALTIIIGAIRAQRRGLMHDVHKVLTTQLCNESLANSTILTVGTTDYGIHKVADPSVFWAFKISLCFYILSGVLIGLVVAVVVSFLTSRQPLDELDPNLIVPQMRWVLPAKAANENADMPMLKVQTARQEGRQDNERN